MNSAVPSDSTPPSLPRPGRVRRMHPGAVGLALAFLLAAGGCIQVEEELTLHRDGSLTAVLSYQIPDQAAPALASFRAALRRWQGESPDPAGVPKDPLPDEAFARKYFGEAGAEVRDFQVSERDGVRTTEIILAAPDARRTLAAGVLGDITLERLSGAPGAPARWRLRAANPFTGRTGATAPEKTRKMLQALCAGARLSLAVVTPGKILQTTAPVSGERRAAWTLEVPAGASGKFPEAIPEMSVVFRGVGRWQ